MTKTSKKYRKPKTRKKLKPKTEKKRKQKQKRQIKTSWKKKKAGFRFRDIITMENKGEFIGLEVEIKRLKGFEEETGATGLDGGRPYMPYYTIPTPDGSLSLTEIVNEPGFVCGPMEVDEVFENESFVNIYYPNLSNGLGSTLALPIQENLRELSHREGSGSSFNYFIQLKRNRAHRVSKLAKGDIFTQGSIRSLNTASTKRNILSPPLRHTSGKPTNISLTSSGHMELPKSMLEHLKGTRKSVDLPPEVLELIAPHIKAEPEQSRMERLRSKLSL